MSRRATDGGGAPIPGVLEAPAHEARGVVLSELHARPFMPLAIPRRVYHFAFATSEEEAEADHRSVVAVGRARGVASPLGDAKFEQYQFASWDLRWEQHTEFTTYTWSTSDEASEAFARSDPVGSREITFRAPGKLVVAAHIALLESDKPTADLAMLFEPQSQCVSGAASGRARVLTDFKADAHGFTRFLIAAQGLSDTAAGRLVQRVLEIETYRAMALLGLPDARRAGSTLGRMEREISDITRALSQVKEQRMSQEVLRRLSDLLAESVAQSAHTAFRFGASRAYHSLVKSRLELIQESTDSDYTTISQFFRARLDPAIETCNAMQARQRLVSEQLVDAADLLRTGIQFDLEQQNRDLLADMNRRARLQLRLQRTVQGLSIAALSYYLAGLVTYVAKGAKDAGLLPHSVTAEMVTALTLPAVVFAAWAFMERVRRLSTRAGADDHAE